MGFSLALPPRPKRYFERFRVLVRVRISFGSALRLFDVDGEFVLLIAAQIRVAHKVELIRVMSRRWSHKVQFDLIGKVLLVIKKSLVA